MLYLSIGILLTLPAGIVLASLFVESWQEIKKWKAK
jgi:hypothetical protein